MRLSVGLCLLAASTVVAVPQKDDLPPGAVGRLTPATGDRPGEVTALLYLGDDTLFVGTSIGWNTWDLRKRQPRQARPVGGAAFAVGRDAERLFVGSARKLHAIEPVESATAEPVRSWDSKSDALGVLAVAPGGQRVVFSDGEQKLMILDPKTGRMLGTAEVPGRPLAVTLTANGRILAVVTREGAVRVFGLSASGALDAWWVKRVARSDRAAVQFSPDGRLLAVSTAGRVTLLEAVTGRPFATLERKFGEGDVRAIAFSPDSRVIAAGSAGPEPVVRTWSVEARQELASYFGHRGDVSTLSFAPDGKTVASGGSDPTVFLWTVSSAPASAKLMAVPDAWEALDSLDGRAAYRATGSLTGDPVAAVAAIRAGFSGQAEAKARVKRWVTELDHDEFRVREAARRNLIKAGLRATEAINDPARKKLGPEGEERIRQVLDELDQQGLRVPESGLYGEPLRLVRAVRVLEMIGTKGARTVLEEMARGPADDRVTKEAKAALEVFTETR
jgi:hypothetical protein